MPIEESMETPQNFRRVLAGTMTLVTVVYAIFGMLGYLAYGSDVKEMITLNLGGGWPPRLVKVALCVVLFFTYPLMMFPVYNIIESSARVYPRSTLFKSGLRVGVVLVSVVVALGIPNFGDFIALVGGGACAALSLVLPAYFNLQLARADMSIAGVLLHNLFVVGGTILGIVATVSAGGELFLDRFLGSW